MSKVVDLEARLLAHRAAHFVDLFFQHNDGGVTAMEWLHNTMSPMYFEDMGRLIRKEFLDRGYKVDELDIWGYGRD